MNFKNKKGKISLFTALLFSLSLAACGTNNGTNGGDTNPPPTGRTNQNNTVRNGRMGTNLNPDGTINDNTLNDFNLDNTQRGTNDNFERDNLRNDNLGNDNLGNDNANEGARTARIERAISGIKGVKSSRVIITGDRAIVGVDMGAATEGEVTNQLKRNIEKAVKNTDKNIRAVAVSADPDLFERITRVGEGITGGRPLSQFGNEIEEIFRRIMPR